jgi:hypothetical protein
LASDSSSGRSIVDAKMSSPRPTAGRPTGEARGARPLAARQQMINMAAMLEGHTLVYGADHFGQAVP